MNQFEKLNAQLNNINQKCQPFPTFGLYNSHSILTGIYIKCPSVTLQIVIIYERGAFFWIGEDSLASDEPKTFGDVPRAIRK